MGFSLLIRFLEGKYRFNLRFNFRKGSIHSEPRHVGGNNHGHNQQERKGGSVHSEPVRHAGIDTCIVDLLFINVFTLYIKVFPIKSTL